MTLISDFFEEDHRRLDVEFNHFQRAKGDDAKKIFRCFKEGLIRHINWEEQLLFPALEEQSNFSANSGPTRVMRIEHEQIMQLLNLIEQKMEDNEDRDLLERRLLDVLAEHNIKEERVLYPMCDSLISADSANSMLETCRVS